jgi:hypothetical protein
MPTHSSDSDPRGEPTFGPGHHYSAEHDDVDRVETFIRILYTLLFFLILRVIEAATGVIVLFQLVFALITNRTPNPAVSDFARRIIEYGYQIAYYVSYNRERPPFPFDELPD